jgi:Fe-S cluster biosynthesis and repair protein YggX
LKQTGILAQFFERHQRADAGARASCAAIRRLENAASQAKLFLYNARAGRLSQKHSDEPLDRSGPVPREASFMAERLVKCVKFQKELPGLDEPPWSGELGQRIYDNVSQQAWDMWLEHLKMIINEYRLSPATKEAQEIIAQQMEQFFFGEGAALPPGYVPQQKKG